MADVDTRGDARDTGARPGARPSGSTAATRARRGPSRRGLAVAVLTTLLVALLVATGLLVAHDLEVGQRPEQRQAALEQARKVALQIIGINGGNASEKIEALLAETTGPYRERLTTDSGALATALRDGQISSTAAIAAAGLETFDDDTASALVVLNGTLVNADAPQGQPVSYRLALQLRHEGDRWLVSTVEVIP